MMRFVCWVLLLWGGHSRLMLMMMMSHGRHRYCRIRYSIMTATKRMTSVYCAIQRLVYLTHHSLVVIGRGCEICRFVWEKRGRMRRRRMIEWLGRWHVMGRFKVSLWELIVASEYGHGVRGSVAFHGAARLIEVGRRARQKGRTRLT